jgi:hypothetical protein
MDDLVNQFTMGHTNYPISITSAYNLLINYRVTTQSTSRIINYSEVVFFVTVDVKKYKDQMLPMPEKRALCESVSRQRYRQGAIWR